MSTPLSIMSSRSLLVLYGSETGCAQDVAETIARQGKRRHFETSVLAMDDYDKMNLIEESLVIFVCSTVGQGREPYNMKTFWRFLLRKNLPNDILNGISCAVFGLGDSSYSKFNYPAKKLHKRLIQLGANMIQTRGDGDDQHYMGLDGELVPWLKTLWDNVMNKYPLPTGKEIIQEDVLLPPSFRIEFASDQASSAEESQTSLRDTSHSPEEFDMVLKSNDRITAIDHFQDVRHIVLHCNSIDFNYEAGDTAAIMPQNMPEEIDLFLEQMKWSHLANLSINIGVLDGNRKLPAHWPTRMKFKDLLIYHLDIFGVPRRSFFQTLSHFTKDTSHTERLRELITPEGQDDMIAYCQRPRRTIEEVLFDFGSFEIPTDYILDLFPPLQPRSYSIASSLKAHPNELHLCVAIVKYKTKMRKIRRGVFTKWLSTLIPGDLVKHVHINKGTMSLPSQDVPLITIGPGTGVAPMRSFLEERILQHTKSNLHDSGNILFVGCRHRDKDYYYKEQWDHYASNNCLTVLTAFSRDQDTKIYVQDRIRENASLLWHLIDKQQAKIMLSGASDNMPAQVTYALKQVFMEQGNLEADEAEKYFNTMVKTEQYQEECWS
ncbi:hypothetical protein BDF14DRAFT_1954287 [Spinellus fusiger]|nr:hypothetical protein BDF14DRAFT_1954287 [Spinellus fusiger]